MNNHQTGRTAEQMKTRYVRSNSNLACLGRNDISTNRPVVLDPFEELAHIKAHNSEVGYVY